MKGQKERGASLVEYALLLGIVVAIGYGVLSGNLKDNISSIMNQSTNLVAMAAGDISGNGSKVKVSQSINAKMKQAIQSIADGLYKAGEKNNIKLEEIEIDSQGNIYRMKYYKADGTPGYASNKQKEAVRKDIDVKALTNGTGYEVSDYKSVNNTDKVPGGRQAYSFICFDEKGNVRETGSSGNMHSMMYFKETGSGKYNQTNYSNSSGQFELTK